MGASPILEHAEDAKTPHRILVRSLLTSRNKLCQVSRAPEGLQAVAQPSGCCGAIAGHVARAARAKEATTCSAEATQSIVESQSQELPERSEQRGHELAPLSAPLTAPHGTEKRGR